MAKVCTQARRNAGLFGDIVVFYQLPSHGCSGSCHSGVWCAAAPPPAQQPGTEGFHAASSSTKEVTRSGGKKFCTCVQQVF